MTWSTFHIRKENYEFLGVRCFSTWFFLVPSGKFLVRWHSSLWLFFLLLGFILWLCQIFLIRNHFYYDPYRSWDEFFFPFPSDFWSSLSFLKRCTCVVSNNDPLGRCLRRFNSVRFGSSSCTSLVRSTVTRERRNNRRNNVKHESRLVTQPFVILGSCT